jgi:hypothetical protein
MDEIAELKAQIAALSAKVAALEDRGARKVIPTPPESVVMVSHPVAVSSFVMPDADELDRLAEIVCSRYPMLASTQGPAFEGSRHERREEWTKRRGRRRDACGDRPFSASTVTSMPCREAVVSS